MFRILCLKYYLELNVGRVASVYRNTVLCALRWKGASLKNDWLKHRNVTMNKFQGFVLY